MGSNRTAFFVRRTNGMHALEDLAMGTGNRFFVCSVTGTDAAGYGNSPDSPVATIAYALTLCTASKGDIIFVMPGHAETIATAGGLTLNVAGVQLIGLGNGSIRPTLTLSATASTIAISAANVALKNLIITTSVDAVVKVFNVTGANCTLDGVDFRETAACSCLQFILTAATATDLTVKNCAWVNTATQSASAQQWILLVGADRFRCENCFASLNGVAAGANGVIVGATTASKDVVILRNHFQTVGSTSAVPISLLAASTGLVADNFVASAKTAIAGSVAIANAYARNNYACHVVNKSGLLDPVVDA